MSHPTHGKHVCGQPCEVECPFTTDFCHSQKLESIGLLVGEVAHDLNNLLAIIVSHADLALEDATAGLSPQSRIGSIREAAHNAAALCQSILAHAGQSAPVRVKFRLGVVIAQLHQLMRVAVPRHIRLECHVAENLPPLLGDPSHVRQILLNLVINAAEAMDKQAGTIRIDVDSAVMDPQSTSPWPASRIRVSDNGCGMAPETIQRLFTPFYTTKAEGRGLGLAAVRTLVVNMGGTIQAESTRGEGTCFTILLPQPLLSETENPDQTVTATNALTSKWNGKGTVLFAEDEPDLRTLSASMLDRAGLRVIMAADGHEALEYYQHHQQEIDLIFLDMVMPRMNGCEAMARIREINPEARIVMISGYTESELKKRWNGVRPDDMLLKPFSSDQLREMAIRHLAAVTT